MARVYLGLTDLPGLLVLLFASKTHSELKKTFMVQAPAHNNNFAILATERDKKFKKNPARGFYDKIKAV